MDKDNISPSFWSRIVYILECRACGEEVSRRAMRAILLADKRIELFSTDFPDCNAIGVVPDIFTTAHCYCKIQKIACRCCGSEVGYHVLTPCKKCLGSCNNGHFWMFDSDGVVSSGRMSVTDGDYIIWKNLLPPGEDDTLECLR
ncbi:hypothetical protein ACOMHN_021546 [Nucella lapillus]